MNILIIDHYAGAPRWGMEYRPHYLARHWQESGHRVLVAAADYTHLRRINPVQQQPVRRVKEAGVEYLLLRTPHYDGNGLARARNVWAFLHGLSRLLPTLAEEFPPDVILASSTYPFDFYPARKLARRCGSTLVFELHDIWPMSLLELYDFSPVHPLMLAIDRAERTALGQADLVVSLLPYADRYLRERSITPRRYLHIPNGIEPREPLLPPPGAFLDLTRRYREKGMFLVVYVGGFSAANAMESFVEAAALCKGDQLFLAVGNGPAKIPLKRLAKERKVPNLLFLDGVERGQVQGVLAQADCLYLGAHHTPLYQYGISMNKLFDYMLAAKPILCGVEADRTPVELAGCGLTVDGEDPQAIADAVRRLQALPEKERLEMGERGRAYVLAHHDYRELAARFLEELMELRGGGRHADPNQTT